MITLKDAQNQIGVGKTTLYKYLKKLEITPKNRKGRSCITQTELDQIKTLADPHAVNDREPDEQSRTNAGEQHEQPRTNNTENAASTRPPANETPRTPLNNPRTIPSELEKELRNQIGDLKKERVFDVNYFVRSASTILAGHGTTYFL